MYLQRNVDNSCMFLYPSVACNNLKNFTVMLREPHIMGTKINILNTEHRAVAACQKNAILFVISFGSSSKPHILLSYTLQ